MPAPWFHRYLGLPWVSKASGPAAFDCWGLVVWCLREHFDICVDDHSDVATHDHRGFERAALREINGGRWLLIDQPVEGAVVLMSRARLFHHVGLFTAGGVLHSLDGADCCHEPLTHLTRSGVIRFEFRLHESLAARSR